MAHEGTNDPRNVASAADTRVTKGDPGARDHCKAIHWKVPALMVANLLLGIAVALAHHFFYQRLDGRATDGSENTFSQAVNTGIGTAFAFLFKSFLVLATATAYAQLFWHQLKSRDVVIQEIDSLSASLTSIMDFVRPRLWLHHPILLGIAAIAWLLPLAALVAPTALTTRVSPAMRQSYSQLPIAKPDFNRSTYAAFSLQATPYIDWNGPQSSLNRIVLAVAAQGSILAAPIPAVNSTYVLHFHGPSLSCKDPPTAYNRTFQSIIQAWGNQRGDNIILLYASWRSLLYGQMNALNAVLGSSPGINDTLDFLGTEQSIYFALAGNPITVLECTLFNTSYVIDLVNLDGTQKHHIKSAQTLNTIDTVSSISLTKETVSWETVAYETILAAVYQIFIGSIIRAVDADMDIITTTSTLVMSTPLGLSRELYSILLDSEFQVGVKFGTAPLEPSSHQVLSRLVEELFLNITLSLMSSERFRTNFSDPETDHKLTNVTISTPYIVYDYSPRNLIAAYASGISVSILSVIIGGFVLSISGKCYTMNFSTILRTTRNAELGTTISPTERDGREPLPKHIARAKLSLRETHDAEGTREGGIVIQPESHVEHQHPNTEEGISEAKAPITTATAVEPIESRAGGNPQTKTVPCLEGDSVGDCRNDREVNAFSLAP